MAYFWGGNKYKKETKILKYRIVRKKKRMVKAAKKKGNGKKNCKLQ